MARFRLVVRYLEQSSRPLLVQILAITGASRWQLELSLLNRKPSWPLSNGLSTKGTLRHGSTIVMAILLTHRHNGLTSVGCAPASNRARLSSRHCHQNRRSSLERYTGFTMADSSRCFWFISTLNSRKPTQLRWRQRRILCEPAFEQNRLKGKARLRIPCLQTCDSFVTARRSQGRAAIPSSLAPASNS